MFIFLLQSVWVYISELAGKDLEFDVILKFLIYVSPRIVVLVLPLTVLLVSIMVFGNFAENYEFAAMKSTGISLQRAMKSLSVFIIFLSIVSFFFANNVIPLAEYNFYNLRQNIARVKPAMIVAEGQFNQIQDINIKVAKKSGVNGEFLEDVIIHQKKGNSSGNYTVIKSKTGEFYSDESSDLVQLILYNGNYYDEIQSANYQKRTKNRPQIKSTFERYVINIDVSKLELVNIYPNPANDQLTIDCGNLDNVEGWRIKITNMLGQEVFNEPMDTQQYVIPLNTWTGKGMYFVKIINSENDVVNIKKIVLQ